MSWAKTANCKAVSCLFSGPSHATLTCAGPTRSDGIIVCLRADDAQIGHREAEAVQKPHRTTEMQRRAFGCLVVGGMAKDEVIVS